MSVLITSIAYYTTTRKYTGRKKEVHTIQDSCKFIYTCFLKICRLYTSNKYIEQGK